MRPTRAGLATAAATGVLLVLAWLLGLPELAVVCLGSLVVLLLAAVTVLLRPATLSVDRTIVPGLITDGGRGEVRLRITNTARRTSPVVAVGDDAGEFGTARLLLAPLRPGDGAAGTYALPPAKRGLHSVGPMTVARDDVFGLFRRTHTIDGVSTFIVWPRIHDLGSLPPAPGDEPEHSTRSPTATATMDEEFAALRDYVAGDDIRRIHWASTARRGAPVVRHFEQPWLRRVTVLVDRCTDGDPDAFERVVSAAASVLGLAARAEVLVRVLDSHGGDTGFVAADESAEALTDQLAVLTPVVSSTDVATTAAIAASLRAGAGWLIVIGTDDAAIAAAASGSPSCRGLSTSGGSAPPVGCAVWDGTRPLDEVWSELLDATPVLR